MDIQGAAPAPREIDTSGLPMDQAQALVLDELRGLTERSEPFAAILLMPAPPEGRTPASSASAPGTSTADRVRTLKLIRPGLTAHCRGLAFVAPHGHPGGARGSDPQRRAALGLPDDGHAGRDGRPSLGRGAGRGLTKWLRPRVTWKLSPG